MIDFTPHFQDLKTVSACLAKRDELSNSGRFNEIKQIIKTATPEQKQKLGQELNGLKQSLQSACDARIKIIQSQLEQDQFTEFDPTFHSPKYLQNSQGGNLHPISLVVKDIINIFEKWGFDVDDSNLVESQWYNFTSVNMPDYHPARGMQDAFFLEQKDSNGETYVMRTQVTANAVKYTETHKPPFRVIFPGLVFRMENIDATHDINFTQFDMWLVDKRASMSQLITLINQFFSQFFNDPDLQVRLRPSFFPFTLPSLEGDISCPFCKGEGCRICKKTGWIEVFGAGPIHPNVIKNMNLDPQEWEGIAFGFGVDRLAQLKFDIDGISQFYNGQIDFLKGRTKLG